MPPDHILDKKLQDSSAGNSSPLEVRAEGKASIAPEFDPTRRRNNSRPLIVAIAMLAISTGGWFAAREYGHSLPRPAHFEVRASAGDSGAKPTSAQPAYHEDQPRVPLTAATPAGPSAPT